MRTEFMSHLFDSLIVEFKIEVTPGMATIFLEQTKK